jgi:hypothetical protein
MYGGVTGKAGDRSPMSIFVRLIVKKKSKPPKKIPESPFEKYRGIGNPGIPRGRKAIIRWIREMRGH